MFTETSIKLFQEIFAQCEAINILFNQEFVKKGEDEPSTDKAKREMADMMANANIQLAKAVEHVEGLDTVELGMTDCSDKYVHKCDVTRLQVGWLVLTLRGGLCRTKRGELITEMAKQHEIKYDSRPAQTPFDKAMKVIYRYTSEIFIMMNDLEDFKTQDQAVIMPKVIEANVDIAEVIKDVDGLDFAVVTLTDGKTEKRKDTDTKVVLEVGGGGVQGLWTTIRGKAAQEFATKMREESQIRCVREINSPHV